MNNLKILQNVDFDNSYSDVMLFNNLTQQTSYFNQRVEISFENTQITRVNRGVKVQRSFNELINYNYLMFENNINGVTKRFYAFIVEINYINPNTTELLFEVDVMQTYMFDYELKDSFVEREHQDRFKKVNGVITPLFNTQPESLEVGSEYDVKSDEKLLDSPQIALTDANKIIWTKIITSRQVSVWDYSNIDRTKWANSNRQLRQNNLGLSVYVYLMPRRLNGSSLGQIKFMGADGTVKTMYNDSLSNVLAYSNECLSISVLPYSPIKYTIDEAGVYHFVGGDTTANATAQYDPSVDIRLVNVNNTDFKIAGEFGSGSLADIGGYALNVRNITLTNGNFDIATLNINNYINNINLNINTPVNKNYETKLFTPPFTTLQLSTFQTEPLKLGLQNITTNKIKYLTSLDILPKSKLWVENYNNDNGKNYNIINNSMNDLTMFTSAYLNYINATKASSTTGVAVNTAIGVGVTAFGIATGGVGLLAGVGAGVGIFNNIFNNMMKREDLKNSPDSVRKSGNNLAFDMFDDNLFIRVQLISIKDSYKNIVFNYFLHYGYKSNEFKTPNVKSRYYYNFIKTVGVNINGNINNNTMSKIKSIFNNGVTFWHYRNSETFKGLKNYNFENVEMEVINE